MLISRRGSFGERDPWQTEGGAVTEKVPRALRIAYDRLDDSTTVAATIVAKFADVGPARFVTDVGLLENRFRLARHLREIGA